MESPENKETDMEVLDLDASKEEEKESLKKRGRGRPKLIRSESYEEPEINSVSQEDEEEYIEEVLPPANMEVVFFKSDLDKATRLGKRNKLMMVASRTDGDGEDVKFVIQRTEAHIILRMYDTKDTTACYTVHTTEKTGPRGHLGRKKKHEMINVEYFSSDDLDYFSSDVLSEARKRCPPKLYTNEVMPKNFYGSQSSSEEEYVPESYYERKISGYNTYQRSGRGRPRKVDDEDDEDEEVMPKAETRGRPKIAKKDRFDFVKTVKKRGRPKLIAEDEYDESDDDEPTAKPSGRGRGRPKKQHHESEDEDEVKPSPKKRGRPKLRDSADEKIQSNEEDEDEDEQLGGEDEENEAPVKKQGRPSGSKKGRGRPKK